MALYGFWQRHVPAGAAGGGAQRAAGASVGGSTVSAAGHTHSAGGSSGAHDHFDFVKAQPYCVLAASMRQTSDIATYCSSAAGRAMHSIDSAVDADRITFTSSSPDNILSLSKAQLWFNYPMMGQDSGNSSLSWQWEVMFDSMWLNTFLSSGNVSGTDLNAFKAFRVDQEAKPVGFDPRMLEMQTRFSKTDSTAVALPTVRVYGMTTGGSGSIDPLSTLVGGSVFDWQPGGDTRALSSRTYGAADQLALPDRPFVIRANKWVRYTLTWYFDPPNPARVRLVMADQDNDPVVVVADPSNASLGFIADRPQPGGNNSDRLRLEFNSSSTAVPLIPFVLWVRNVVVAKNTPLPDGGRPIA